MAGSAVRERVIHPLQTRVINPIVMLAHNLQERSRGRHQHVTGIQQLPQRPRSFRSRAGRLQPCPAGYLREPRGNRVQPALVTTRKHRRAPLATIACAVSPPI